MRVRHDRVIISALLFSLALVVTVPTSLNAAMVLGPRHALELEAIGELGVVSVAVSAIGLIVAWTGYIQKARSAWVVLLTIALGWAFPVLLLPFVLHVNREVTLGEWISGALQKPDVPRSFLESILVFLLMVVALLIPLKSFFGRGIASNGPKRPAP